MKNVLSWLIGGAVASSWWGLAYSSNINDSVLWAPAILLSVASLVYVIMMAITEK